MNKKEMDKVFKSFEQFKAEMFPNLAEQEQLREDDKGTSWLGSHLADKAIDKMLSKANS